MKKINLLLSSLLISNISNSFDTSSIKKDLFNIGKEIYKNISREEKEVETFQIEGEKIHSSKELIDLGKGKIEYNLYLENENLYFSIYPKKDKNERITYENYFTILEGTDLFISFPNNNQIINYSSQGEFIKQKFFEEEKIEKLKKGLLYFEDHKEAKNIIDTGEKSLENIVSLFGKKIQKKFEDYIQESEKEYFENIKEKLNPPKDFSFERIPLGVPDKLIGQKLSSIEYKINFKELPKNFSIYSILNLKEEESKLLKKIEINLD